MQTTSRRQAIRAVVQEYLRRRQCGEDISDERMIAEHPELMPELSRDLKALALIRGARERAENATAILDPSRPEDGIAEIDGLSDDTFPGYRILGELHRGGQGVIYQAIQESTSRIVAIKVMLDGPFAGERAHLRFEREVKLVAGFKHPHIVVVHDSGIANGRYYFAMDYIEGHTLDAHVRSAGLSVQDTVRLFVKICDAVSYSHRHGVIHRDIKPSNILVAQDGSPYVVDFGLAKAAEDGWGVEEGLATQPGFLLGTLHYMSPEQTAGEPEAIDARTDVYSWGVVLYQLLTGSMPTDTSGDFTQIIRNIRETDPPRPSRVARPARGREINSEVDAILLKALEKDPNRRYQSVSEFQQDLVAWLEARPVIARSASSLYLLRKIVARHSLESLLVLTVIAALIGFGSITLHSVLQAREAESGKSRSDRAFATAHSDLEDIGAAARAAGGESVLGWFLAEWHGGRLDRAREIQEATASSAPEYGAAMLFLLDDSMSPERLRAVIGTNQEALLHFVEGERLLSQGSPREALAAFGKSASAPGGGWLQSAALARIRQLEDDPVMRRGPEVRRGAGQP